MRVSYLPSFWTTISPAFERVMPLAPTLGVSWVMEPATIRGLATRGLIAIDGDGTHARLTPRGLWYARTAVHHATKTAEATR